MSDKPAQRFDLTVDGRAHRVEITDGALRREIRWYVDDELEARHEVGRREGDPEAGGRRPRPAGTALLDARPPAPGHAVRGRARRRRPGPPTGIGGIDLDPEPGSRAAAYEQKVREHPRRYAAIQTAGGVAKVVVPLLFVFLAGAVHVLAAAARREPARPSRRPTCPTCRRSRGRTSTCRTGRCPAGCARSWRRRSTCGRWCSPTSWPAPRSAGAASRTSSKAGLRQQDERDGA